MSQYNYTKSPVSPDRLTKEIQESAIVTALDYITLTGTADLSIFFKAELSSGDETILEGIIDSHSGEPLPQNIPQEVVTQFEKEDKILQLACGSADVGEDGYATIEIKVPGTYSGGPGRWVDAGRVWFDPKHIGDKVEKVEIVDIDGTIAPAGYVVRKWHDSSVPEANRGWYIPSGASGIEVTALGGYGYIPGGLYLRVKAKKGESQITGKLFLNLKWGEQE